MEGCRSNFGEECGIWVIKRKHSDDTVKVGTDKPLTSSVSSPTVDEQCKRCKVLNINEAINALKIYSFEVCGSLLAYSLCFRSLALSKCNKAGSECVGLGCTAVCSPFFLSLFFHQNYRSLPIARHEKMSSTTSETIYLVTGAHRGRFNLLLFLFSHLPTMGYSYLQSRICFD